MLNCKIPTIGFFFIGLWRITAFRICLVQDSCQAIRSDPERDDAISGTNLGICLLFF